MRHAVFITLRSFERAYGMMLLPRTPQAQLLLRLLPGALGELPCACCGT